MDAIQVSQILLIKLLLKERASIGLIFSTGPRTGKKFKIHGASFKISLQRFLKKSHNAHQLLLISLDGLLPSLELSASVFYGQILQLVIWD
jgi:hypothetical protein